MEDNNTDQNGVLQQRMYFIVLYNLSPIQQGIQALHAAVDYGQEYGNDPDYLKWANTDKTVVILTGGGSPVLVDFYKRLLELGVKTKAFREPDLYDGITAISFLADERVWDREKYPDTLPPLEPTDVGGGVLVTPAIHRVFDLPAFIERIGEKNYKLRELIFKSKLRLA